MERTQTFSARRRNHALTSHRRDGLIEWIKDMLTHSFVLNSPDTYRDTMLHIEQLLDEHAQKPNDSELKSLVPSMGPVFTTLPLADAFEIYDTKYAISGRRFVGPGFNEVRHILNLAQVMAIGRELKLITFDGDQTLYSDGGNFDQNSELCAGILNLLSAGVCVAVVTAAGYGLDSAKYEVRLEGLLRAIEAVGLDAVTASRLLVLGGECNYLLRCAISEVDGVQQAHLEPVPADEWQAEGLDGPKPLLWPDDQVQGLLDIAQQSFETAISELKLRARVIRKARGIGMIPGGSESVGRVPVGHGSNKFKREALDEVVLRVIDAIRRAEVPVTLPFCAFNGGRDAWVDVGDKSVGVAALQAWLGIPSSSTIHVGDQFLNVGNDIKAREQCPCLWIISPSETAKMLAHVANYCEIPAEHASGNCGTANTTEPKMCVFTGEIRSPDSPC